MSVRFIYEVRQRSWDKTVSRELGVFVDEMMATQVIDFMYKAVWGQVAKPDFIGDDVWLPFEASLITITGYDVWFVNEKNSAKPLFYAVPHKIYDSLPTSVDNFILTVDERMF